VKNHRILLLIVLFLNVHFLHGQKWEWQNPKPQGNDLFDVFFLNDSTGWAVGYLGTIIKTGDYGKNWEIQNSHVADSLMGVHFKDKNIGCVVGANGLILQTTDGGNTWNKYNLGRKEWFYDLHFINADTGYITGTGGIILKSEDGGISWAVIREPESIDITYNSIFFLDKDKGWAAGEKGSILKTINGGATWEKVYANDTLGLITKIKFIDDSNGFCIRKSENYFYSSFSDLYHTTNGGASWQYFHIPPIVSASMVDFGLGDSTIKWFIDIAQFIEIKDNNTFEYHFSDPISTSLAIHFPSPNVAYTVGYSGDIARSTDSGNTWEKLSKDSLKGRTFEKIQFVNQNIGWVKVSENHYDGSKSAFLKTIDGGKNWFNVNGLDEDDVTNTDFHFFNSKEGIVAAIKPTYPGSDTLFLFTNNGGASWEKSENKDGIERFIFIDDRQGWGMKGKKIYKTDNAGKDWKFLTEVSVPYYSIDFLDSLNGWMGGVGGVYHTIDGGKTWNFQQIEGNNMYEVDFINTKDGLITSSHCVYRTTDGGGSWQKVYRDDINSIGDLNFFSKDFALFVASGGGIIISGDGGRTWHKEDHYGYLNNTSDVFVVNDQTAWFIGQTTILKRTGLLHSEYSNVVRGNVFKDLDHNCKKDSLDFPLKNWIIKAEPGPYYAISNSSGVYELKLDSGDFIISQILPEARTQEINPTCPLPTNNYKVRFNGYDSLISELNFTNDVSVCAYLDLSISSSRRRRCFRNNTTIEYGNYGFKEAENVSVYVKFPQFVKFITANVPWTVDVDSNYVFNIGKLNIGQRGQINIIDSVICGDESIRGLTQCTKAWITPSNNCQPPSPSWDKSSIKVAGICKNNFVSFTMQNKGSGDMKDSSEYRVYFDNTLVGREKFKLNANDSLILNIPANGQTVRLEADQSQGHPGKSKPTATIERCGSEEQGKVSSGFVSNFYQDDEDPEVDIECLPIIDSFDPNEKVVTPQGITDENYIKPLTELEYEVKFQNTGSDIAYKVIVVDTLSERLNPATLAITSSSHSYKLTSTGKGKLVLIFTFEEIDLPTSSVDEKNSHGYIKFKIAPYDTIPINTRIDNFADIFFDYNSPIRTNTTFVTLSDYVPTDLSKLNLEEANCSNYSVSLNDFEKICDNALPVKLSGGAPEGGTYSGDGIKDGFFDPVKAGVGEHLVTYKNISSNQCIDSVSRIIVVEVCTGVEKEISGGVRIFPNPVKTRLHITMSRTSHEKVRVQIFNSVGLKVSEKKVGGSEALILDIENLVNGLYILKIKNSKKEIVKDFIKE
jgi:photosystem II stability/assembly factor-like uncharacterized protein